MVRVSLLDYGAGNIRSLRNALVRAGCDIEDVKTADDISQAHILIFPGVGSFGVCIDNLHKKGFFEPLKAYLKSGRAFYGICLGMQSLFEGSEETPGLAGLGIVPGIVGKFSDTSVSVPHMGWNSLRILKDAPMMKDIKPLEDRFYFVHSFRAIRTPENADWVLSVTDYGNNTFISSLQNGRVSASQFHPEKRRTMLAKRIIACLDVRENDSGDLVVTKGDQYDVREKEEGGEVRNLGKPVELARRYSDDGADEVTFLNITSFRGDVVDAPMLRVLELTSEHVFVPLCIGGGIRDYTDSKGVFHSALDVATSYFRSGADKVSIGSDAVYAAEKYRSTKGQGMGSSCIEQISNVYGCTVKGGREVRDLDAFELAQACEALGAGEILLNCIDKDGQNNGFDIALIRQMKASVSIPVIASSGAGKPQHFIDVFQATNADAGLAAGIFHRREVGIDEVKAAVSSSGIPCRT
ncbi:hypothetical protein GUITHDRAFT_159622 [Guillardia theta CCMP2712]|uniref:imidazole glycerol-phosphate synthase n=1 Tax=Guillardia theta (strain CCMP2712) TaxID=905079 RepID=L1JDA4_GUITC|nr:hypothetical protein GUITHDRAFT_159622 [Guillardia theta CCMP2712]EKX46496.1 hypothetical protein GUITHDRAFT_159622 [Guillardia theta CCMP2712]|eukprot:XP_005833476.1 hypothetical protein GUITHDRAFT_159622 [Guillardia theta CCMP2712]